jgi:hypothetical protein
MRLVTYDAGDGGRAGMIVDGRVVDAWAALGEPHRGSLRELIEQGRIDDLHSRIGDTGAPSHPLSAVRLLPPIPDPDKIICIGLNYAKHAAEGRQEVPESPTFFGKYRNALAADGETVQLPATSRKVDYEAEVAFVVGRTAKAVAEADALDFIAGYMLFDDLSARDLQFATPQWMAGKVFDGSERARPRHPRGGGCPRRDRDRTDPERGEDAGRLDRQPDLRNSPAAVPPLGADDARAGRHRRHRHPGRGRRRPRTARLARRRRRDRRQLADPRPAAHEDRPLALQRPSPLGKLFLIPAIAA